MEPLFFAAERNTMKVTPEILKALNRAKDYYGNTTQLAKHLGIAHSTILFWFSGKTKNISGQLWCRLLKEELAPFMADSDEKRKEQGRKEVYCVSCTQFMQFDPTMESPCHFAESHGTAIDFSGGIPSCRVGFEAEECVSILLGLRALPLSWSSGEPLVAQRAKSPPGAVQTAHWRELFF